VGVGLAGVDGHRILEALYGLAVLAALLIDQAELILRSGIVRIQRRGFQHSPEVLPAAQTGARPEIRLPR